MYTNIPGRPLEYASTILACLSVAVTIPIYVVYMRGPQIRAKSKFAQSLHTSRQRNAIRRKSVPSAGFKMGTSKEKDAEKQV